jgi:hypothetical protein
LYRYYTYGPGLPVIRKEAVALMFSVNDEVSRCLLILGASLLDSPPVGNILGTFPFLYGRGIFAYWSLKILPLPFHFIS